MKDNPQRLSSLSVLLHWLVGITFILLLSVGILMEETDALALYPLHKSVGMLLLAAAAVRMLWRAGNGWPVPLGQPGAMAVVTARAVHWMLIIGTVLMPLSGMLMSGGGGHGLSLFGLDLLAANPDPLNPGEVIPLSRSLAGVGHELHEIGGNLMIAAILLHVIGALKHHFIDRDATLTRMLGRTPR
ncbi:cytochrome b [Ferrimonas sediminicola]|nr:cytochrome b [Ferrimonas sediminicola]